MDDSRALLRETELLQLATVAILSFGLVRVWTSSMTRLLMLTALSRTGLRSARDVDLRSPLGEGRPPRLAAARCPTVNMLLCALYYRHCRT